jgi:hypothetical protein
LTQARTEINGISGRLEQQYRIQYRIGVNLCPSEELLGRYSPTSAAPVWAAVGFVLLIACANPPTVDGPHRRTRDRRARRSARAAGASSGNC